MFDNNQTYQAKLEDGSNGTEYRVVTVETCPSPEIARIPKSYLQFKSGTVRKRNLPDFWNTHQEDEWRFIPHGYNLPEHMGLEDCPKEIESGLEWRFKHCWPGQESFDFTGVTSFPNAFPRIEEYLEDPDRNTLLFKRSSRKYLNS